MVQISINDISKIYRIGDMEVRAVSDVSLTIEKGEFISIIGHSGSGKTTLLSIIGGILRPSTGNVVFNNTDIYSLDDNGLSEYRAEKAGYIFQFASLLPALTAKENLLLPAVFRTDINNNERQADDYLALVGLEDKVNSYPSQLSGGQQRRVAIARALMNDPEVVIADEPTGDLDEQTEKEVMDFIKSICRKKKITLILVTHDSGLAKDATRRFKMAGGLLSAI